MKKISLLFVLGMVSILSVTSCKKDDPIIENEEEVITTLTYALAPDGGGASVVLSFKDLDGDGGNAPVIIGGTLAANTTYTGALTLLNETETPAESITAEVLEEAVDHQFFFASSISGVSVAYDDVDPNGKPLGLATTLTTGAEGSGTISVTLRHEPNKSASGVSAGDITNAGGETDIEVTFNVEIQ